MHGTSIRNRDGLLVEARTTPGTDSMTLVPQLIFVGDEQEKACVGLRVVLVKILHSVPLKHPQLGPEILSWVIDQKDIYESTT